MPSKVASPTMFIVVMPMLAAARSSALRCPATNVVITLYEYCSRYVATSGTEYAASSRSSDHHVSRASPPSSTAGFASGGRSGVDSEGGGGGLCPGSSRASSWASMVGERSSCTICYRTD
ncbi:hypothetical protein F5X96DRAFT_619633 [Biscogniauxia mediterranea]|nr:hypothetical protein F5X96DRAFT_619633 [Biscogniauxia mediterranea]